MRSRLRKQVKDLLHAANMFLPNLQEVDLKPMENNLIDTPTEETVELDDLGDGPLEEELHWEDEDEKRLALIFLRQ